MKALPHSRQTADNLSKIQLHTSALERERESCEGQLQAKFMNIVELEPPQQTVFLRLYWESGSLAAA